MLLSSQFPTVSTYLLDAQHQEGKTELHTSVLLQFTLLFPFISTFSVEMASSTTISTPPSLNLTCCTTEGEKRKR